MKGLLTCLGSAAAAPPSRMRRQSDAVTESLVLRFLREQCARIGLRPTLLIGGNADLAFQRAARFADGWTMGGGTPDMFTQALEKLNSAWTEAGREGTPRTLALFYFVLGDDAERMASESLGDYYAFLGEYANQIVASAAKDGETVKQYLSAFESAGADEVICFPASADPRQVDLLADAALG